MECGAEERRRVEMGNDEVVSEMVYETKVAEALNGQGMDKMPL